MIKQRNFRKQNDIPLSLQLGCGWASWPKHVNIDIRDMGINPQTKKPYVDIICDIRDLPYDNGIVDTITALDVLEHFKRDEWFEVLKHWISKLKNGGIIHLRVPDMRVASVVETDDDYLSKFMYGGQDYEFNFHYTGFTAKMLCDALEKLNIKIIKRFHNGGNVTVTGEKIQ